MFAGSGYSDINQFLSGPSGGLSFGGQMSGGELQDLVKSLNLGSDRDPPASYEPGDGFAFRTEDLDPLLRVTTYTEENIVLWKMLQKMAAGNSVVEWNERESHGADGLDGFMVDGTLPEQMDGIISRNHAFVKFMGIQGAVTHGSTLQNTAHGELIGQETRSKVLKLLELVNRALYYGDSSLDSVQWDGYFKQMENAVASGRAPATQIKDVRGRALTIQDIEEGAGITYSEPNYRKLTTGLVNPMVKSDMNTGMAPFQRGQQGVGNTNGGIGQDFKHVVTSIGNVKLHCDPFIHFGRKPASAGLGNAANRPLPPTLTVAPTTPVDGASKFTAAGDYYYTVVARNRYGASAPTVVGTVTVAAGDKVTFGIQGTPGNAATFYEVFRSPRNAGAGTEEMILRIPNPTSNPFATVTVDDFNENLPGTTQAIFFQWEPSVLNFRQLAPMMKVALGQIDLMLRWVQVLYGVPVLYQPKAAYLIKNIARAQLAA